MQSIKPDVSSNLRYTSKLSDKIPDEMKDVNVTLLSVEVISSDGAFLKSPERFLLPSIQNQIEKVDKAVITDEVKFLPPPTIDDTTQTDKLKKIKEREAQTDDLTISRDEGLDIRRSSTGKSSLRGDALDRPHLYTVFPHVVTPRTGVENEIEKLILIPGPVYVPQKILERTFKENAFRDKNLDVATRINISDYETPVYEKRKSQNSATSPPQTWYTKPTDENGRENLHGKTKNAHSHDISTNNLLLSSEYDFDTRPKLSDYFPSVSTQTNSSDISMINKLMNLQTPDVQNKTVKLTPRRTSVEGKYAAKEAIAATSPPLDGSANNVEVRILSTERESRNCKQSKVEKPVPDDYSKNLLKDEESFLNAMDETAGAVPGSSRGEASYAQKFQTNNRQVDIEILDRKPTLGTSPSMEHTVRKVTEKVKVNTRIAL